ncbi:MAG: hypothetical protein HY930_01325 [Euryarchaeota archaeon]|nr:hypothetical protein [Euryarchaeota archaeon]
MKVASNSSPLIHLAQVNALFLLKELYGEVVITEEVRAEAVERGKEEGCADAILIKDAIETGAIKVVRHGTARDFSRFGLHEAEANVISLVLNEKFDLILLDEDAARELARMLGLKVRGSIGVIIEALRKKRITRKEALKFLNELASVMYLSGEAYREAREAIEKA